MARLDHVNRYARAGALRRNRSTGAGSRRWLTVFLGIAVFIAVIKTVTVITGKTNPVDRAINVVATPLVSVVRYTAEGVSSLGQIFHLPSLLRDNRRLREENAMLKRQSAEAQLATTTTADLRATLALSNLQYRAVNATVIARPYDLWLDQVVIDVGARNGVRAGNLVINPSGVVGIVDEKVQDGMSWVTLVTSPRFRLAAITSTEVEGVIKGFDSHAMTLEGVRGKPSNTDDGNLQLTRLTGNNIKLGEKVFTSGIATSAEEGLLRPRGQLIGTVVHRSVDANGRQDVRVEPAVNANRINVVTVITQ
jgi:cell shape-determining protein MreC